MRELNIVAYSNSNDDELRTWEMFYFSNKIRAIDETNEYELNWKGLNLSNLIFNFK